MTADVLDLSTFRRHRGLRIERQSIASLRGAFGLPPALPPVPNAGKVIGDEVRFADGRIGRVSEHRFTDAGLMLTVRVNGWAVRVMARDVDPVRTA